MGEIFSAGQDGTKYDSLRRQNVDGTRRDGTAGPLFTTVFPSNAVLSRRYRQSRPVSEPREALEKVMFFVNSLSPYLNKKPERNSLPRSVFY